MFCGVIYEFVGVIWIGMSVCCSDAATQVEQIPDTAAADTTGKMKTYVAHISVKPTFLLHVLDTTSGCPAGSLPVTLFVQKTGKGWETAEEGHTREDGQLRLLKGKTLNPGGRYKLHIDTGDYFQSRGGTAVYPFIEIGLQIPHECKNLHVSLHIGNNGYATYIGT